MTKELFERVAVLEEWRDSVSDDLKTLTVQTTEINQKLARQSGFFAGIAFCVAGAWTLIGVAVNALMRGQH